MNKQRRSEIKKIVDCLEALYSDLERVKDDEEDAFDSLPENLQGSIRGEEMEEAIGTLNDALDQLEEVKDLLSDF